MKKNYGTTSLVIILVLFSVQILWGQSYPIDQGSKIFWGGMSLQTTYGDLYEDENQNGSFNLTMNPGFGYFILPGVAAGIKLEASSSFQGNDKAYGFGVGPHLSYAYGPHSSGQVARFYPFVEANILYVEETARLSVENYLLSATMTGYKINFGVGVDYMLTESVGIFLEGLYDMESLKYKNDDETYNGNAIRAVVGIIAFIY
ncbi:hypothetical protein JXO59_03650 [candidate division KSB1 bacterium]|nr:hypothetical protein [candidate division KSB1 bacterium]